ncbi:metal-dependent hydrolase [Leptospira gomenensis]|uniref:Metal-dependent hydrolase n=1 Tax=Leptospira gomenensis TaxID=2484974 RepID=A0A5F1YKN2_9LEPT|nr:metal-dependent hydrolase [Leptospira gomenensis]TGK33283.1 metal-dependent hydrolase [Leptospira gomenensis]TGK45124.1 metal-dependent hydrolase [Leptospira gomenensis]TGK50909.1 metal-dependent hydrolase [Leptospira gomenensis]TGK56532.1 metal-dependent hydrolase [Leptospira gomenensis]
MKKPFAKKIDRNAPSVRKLDFEGLDDLPKYYFHDNSIITHSLNSFHVIFPEGERFFIRSVKPFQDKIKDETLRNRVKAFIGQEVQHGKEHERVWDSLRKSDLPVDRIAAFYHWIVYKVIFAFLGFVFGPKMDLSITAALEHYTATLGEISLKYDLARDAYGDMRKLLVWHACEEIEHKSVVYDVMREVAPNYLLRILGFVIATVMLWSFAILFQYWFLIADGEVTWKRFRQDRGYARDYMRITVPPLFRGALRYFKPNFHPDQMGGYELAETSLSAL